MKNISVTIISSILFCVFNSFLLPAQNNPDNPVFNNNGLTYDSIMYILDQKDISFQAKCKLISEDIHTLDPLDKTTEIFKKVLLLAKEENDKDQIFKLYNSIANNYGLIRNTEQMKLYLDSASVYAKDSENFNALGVHYYLLATYYQIIDDGVKSHENNYKAIEYFEKTGGREKLIISIYYNMCLDYFTANDTQSVKKIIEKMKEVNARHSSFESELYTNQIINGYYNGVYKQSKDSALLDSISFYNKKSIDLFESLGYLEQSIAKAHIVYDYYNFIDYEMKRSNPDKKLIDSYMIKLEELIEPNDTSRLIWYHQINGSLLVEKGKYREAEQELLKALDYLEHQKLGKVLSGYLGVYERLAVFYQITGRLEEAIKYRILKEKVSAQVDEQKGYEAVRELDTKYETARKDLEISQLNEEKQRTRFLLILIISIAIFCIVLLFIAFLYNRIKRLRKEKEAVILANRIKEKETEFRMTINKLELNAMQSYLNGLEAERERLAKELHDNVANELLSIDIQLKAEVESDHLSRQIENLHGEIRNISHELMPPKFRYASLPEIIYDYVSKLNERGNLQISVEFDNEYMFENIPDKFALEIYRIIQEAVSNIIKHAEATTAKITLNNEGDTLYLSVEDNGKGFNPDKEQDGIGLRIIRDRIKSLNGKLNIDTAEGKGCKLDIALPIVQ